MKQTKIKRMMELADNFYNLSVPEKVELRQLKEEGTYEIR